MLEHGSALTSGCSSPNSSVIKIWRMAWDSQGQRGKASGCGCTAQGPGSGFTHSFYTSAAYRATTSHGQSNGLSFYNQQDTAIFIAIAGTHARNVTYTMCLYPRAFKTRYDFDLLVLLHASIISYGPIILQSYLVY